MMQLTNKRTSKIQASYKLEGNVLENVESIKYLGVIITKDLKWIIRYKGLRIYTRSLNQIHIPKLGQIFKNA